MEGNNLPPQELNLVETTALAVSTKLAALFPNQVIQDDNGLVIAADALSETRSLLKVAEEQRISMVKPANNYVSFINGEVKKRLAPLKQQEERISNLMSVYRAEVSERRRKEYEESLKAASKKESPLPIVVAPLPVDNTKSVATSQGNVQFRTVTKWEVEDIKKVPRAYLELDGAKVQKAVGIGIAIPGIRVFKEEIPVVRGS